MTRGGVGRDCSPPCSLAPGSRLCLSCTSLCSVSGCRRELSATEMRPIRLLGVFQPMICVRSDPEDRRSVGVGGGRVAPSFAAGLRVVETTAFNVRHLPPMYSMPYIEGRMTNRMIS